MVKYFFNLRSSKIAWNLKKWCLEESFPFELGPLLGHVVFFWGGVVCDCDRWRDCFLCCCDQPATLHHESLFVPRRVCTCNNLHWCGNMDHSNHRKITTWIMNLPKSQRRHGHLFSEWDGYDSFNEQVWPLSILCFTRTPSNALWHFDFLMKHPKWTLIWKVIAETNMMCFFEKNVFRRFHVSCAITRWTPRKREEMCAWRVSTTQSSWKIRDARMSSDPTTTTIAATAVIAKTIASGYYCYCSWHIDTLPRCSLFGLQLVPFVLFLILICRELWNHVYIDTPAYVVFKYISTYETTHQLFLISIYHTFPSQDVSIWADVSIHCNCQMILQCFGLVGCFAACACCGC